MHIQDKVAIVTGGAGGIGLSTVKALLNQGSKHVAIIDTSPKEKVIKLIEKLECEYAKGRISYYSCDVRDATKFSEHFDEVAKLFGKVDILINNAGVANESNYEIMIDVNFKAVVTCAITAINRMGKHNGGSGGVIINMCSVFGLIELPAVPVYSATKRGVLGFTKALTNYDKTIGVKVMAVCPGATDTAMLSKEFINAFNLQEEMQSPDYVANAVIKVIEEGKAGEAWVSEHKKTCFVVSGPEDYSKKSKTPFIKIDGNLKWPLHRTFYSSSESPK